MTERVEEGYCVECPVAEVIQSTIDEYFSEDQKSNKEVGSVIVETMPEEISDEEWADAARAFSMTDREAVLSGVSQENIEKMRETLTDSLRQLGGCALESLCPGKRSIGEGEFGCQAVGSAIIYERFLMALEKYILGFE